MPVRKLDDVLTSGAPAILAVDRKSIQLCIIGAIGDYLNFIGVDTMNDAQIVETASMMIDNHPHVQVDAIKSFFYEAKRGTYGFHYNKMDGTKLLMWYDEFVKEYYRQLDDLQYAKHLNTKGELAAPIDVEDWDGEPLDYERFLAAFHGKTKEQMAKEKRISAIRNEVFKQNQHLYQSMPVEEADKEIDKIITKRLSDEGLITF